MFAVAGPSNKNNGRDSEGAASIMGLVASTLQNAG
jgi:hypothetical protein